MCLTTYHLLCDIDIGLSKGFWQKLLSKCVHCGWVDSYKRYHTWNTRAQGKTQTASLSRGQKGQLQEDGVSIKNPTSLILTLQTYGSVTTVPNLVLSTG